MSIVLFSFSKTQQVIVVGGFLFVFYKSLNQLTQQAAMAGMLISEINVVWQQHVVFPGILINHTVGDSLALSESAQRFKGAFHTLLTKQN